MTEAKILTNQKAPFCQGCGHGVIVKNISKSLILLGFSEKDVVIVSDIGCSGLVDPLFNTHSIHGLHGRAPALGVGVSLGLNNPNKKVIVIIGDGGVTIGLQHVLEAARRNVNLTLVVMNNLLYGMTGGQISGLSTQKFKDLRKFDADVPPFDIIQLAHASGGAYSARVTNIKEQVERLVEAVSTKGFSIVEMSSLCTSYAFKKVGDLMDVVEESEVYTNNRLPAKVEQTNSRSLFEHLEVVEGDYPSKIVHRIGVVMAGSAGGGVQSAAKMLANSGMRSSFNATMKGEYPVTVGTGFSVAEIILSREPIYYTGLDRPDVFIIVSSEGLQKVRHRIRPESTLVMDEQLRTDEFPDAYYRHFVKSAGKRGAALSALAFWMHLLDLLEIGALKSAVSSHKRAEVFLQAIRVGEELV